MSLEGEWLVQEDPATQCQTGTNTQVSCLWVQGSSALALLPLGFWRGGQRRKLIHLRAMRSFPSGILQSTPWTCNCAQSSPPTRSLSSLISSPCSLLAQPHERSSVVTRTHPATCLCAFASAVPSACSAFPKRSLCQIPINPVNAKIPLPWGVQIWFFPPLKPRTTLSLLLLSVLSLLFCGNCTICLIPPNKWQVPYFRFNSPESLAQFLTQGRWPVNVC